MARMEWVRWYIGTHADPKWRVVAADAGVAVTAVVAVWGAMLENARSSKTPGALEGWNDRVVGAPLDLTGEQVAAIRQAMQGLTLEGETLTGWEDRNPKREDDSGERVQRYRERKVTQRNAPVTQGNVGAEDVTPVTLLEVRSKKGEGEEDNGGGSGTGDEPEWTGQAKTAAAIGGFCERQKVPWGMKGKTIDEWANELHRKPQYAGIDIADEIDKCADWCDENGVKRRDIAATVRNWLDKQVEFLAERRRASKRNGGRDPLMMTPAEVERAAQLRVMA